MRNISGLTKYSIRKVFGVTLSVAIITFMLLPYTPDRTITISFVSQPDTMPLRFIVKDSSLFKSRILTDPSGRPIIQMMEYCTGEPGTKTFGWTTTTSWTPIPSEGIEFETEQVFDTTESIELSVFVSPWCGWQKKWISSPQFSIKVK
jgi:hypothetical protein